jgi:hypothetical protein
MYDIGKYAREADIQLKAEIEKHHMKTCLWDYQEANAEPRALSRKPALTDVMVLSSPAA